jgi:hypothetical protein
MSVVSTSVPGSPPAPPGNLWCSQLVIIHPQEDLPNFGYEQYMKVLKTLKSSFIFWLPC